MSVAMGIAEADLSAETDYPMGTAKPVLLQIDTTHPNVHNIPEDCPRVAGYDTGTPNVKWSADDWALFLKTAEAVVHINQMPGTSPLLGDVFDSEDGAWTIPELIGALKIREAHNLPCAAYIQESNLGSLRSALLINGITHCDIWLADWNLNLSEATNMLEVSGPYPIVCVQWASPSSNPDTLVPGSTLTLREANVDLSVALASWLTRSVAPPPPPVLHAELQVPAAPAKVINITSLDSGKTWFEQS